MTSNKEILAHLEIAKIFAGQVSLVILIAGLDTKTRKI